MQLGGKQFTLLEETLAEEHTATQAKLENGTVPDTADLLLLVAPESLTEKQLFAVDQFLMRGGTVVLATSPFDIETRGRLSARKHESGLEEWLAHNGITIDDKMVLDPQNAAFPIPVQRNLGGFIVQETQMVEYPFFVDIREDGLNRDSGIIAGIDQVTLNWASPISVDEEKSQGRTVTPILYSSDAAWTSDSIEIQPDFAAHGDLGFPAGDDAGKKLLAVSVEGGFDSFFKDKPSPLAAAAEDEEEADNGDGDGQEKPPAISRMIDKSPESARIVVFASNTFLTDEVLDLAASGMGTRYLNPVQLVTNAVDWSLEDRELLSIRGRGHFSRTLLPLDRDAQVFWEYLNYILALLGLVAVWLFRRTRLQAEQARQQAILDLGRA
jgi:ABC-2 type transport system permease protein